MTIHAEVGITPGSFAVSASGAATYEVPIEVPPGISEVEPRLAVNYSSQKGNGELGVGWSLAGLSSVHRCPATLEQDDFSGDVNYDADDRFCWDGKRLIEVNPAYDAGDGNGQGVLYKADGDVFADIVGYGSQGTGPAWFKIWTRDGHTMEFGKTADSRIEAAGKQSVRVWALNKVSDVVSNYLTVAYAEDNVIGEYRPITIEYTGNVVTGTLPTRKIEFLYDAPNTRPDPLKGYFAGSPVTTDRRLTDIRISIKSLGSATWGRIRNYAITYESQPSPRTKQSRIEKIIECGQTDTSCLPAIRFGWQNGSETVLGSPVDTLFPQYRNYEIRQGDFNGDGVTDVLFWNSDAGALYIHVIKNGVIQAASYINTNLPTDTELYLADFFPDGITDVLLLKREWSANDNFWLHRIINVEQSGGGLQFSDGVDYRHGRIVYYGDDEAFVADFSGDGIADILVRYKSSNTFALHVVRPDGTFFSQSPYEDAPPNAAVKGIIEPGSKIHIGDYNGDGVPDVLAHKKESGALQINTFRNGKLQLPMFQNSAFHGGDLYAGDYNGDGITDLAFLESGTTLHIELVDAETVIAHAGTYTLPFWSEKLVPTDYNNDGTADLLAYRKAANDPERKFEIYAVRNGIIQETLHSYTGLPPSAINFVNTGVAPGDFNGDGLTDVLYWDDVHGKVAKIYTSQGVQPDLLTRVFVDEIGAETIINYKTLNNVTPRSNLPAEIQAVYTKASGDDAAKYPVVDMMGPMHVVESVNSSNGLVTGAAKTDQKNTVYYAYGGAKVALNGRGRGFLGFQWRKEFEALTGVITTTRFAIYEGDGNAKPWTAHYNGQILGTETRLNGVTLAATSNQWKVHGKALEWRGKQYYFTPLIEQSIEDKYELDGSLIKRTESTFSYDEYGNAVTVTELITGGGNTYKTTTINQYVDKARGRLEQATVTKWQAKRDSTAQGSGTFGPKDANKRVSSFTYWPNGLLKTETIEPFRPELSQTTSYWYDNFGNIEKSEINGADIATRRTTSNYLPNNGLFPRTQTKLASDSVSHTETYNAYDERFGAVTSLTGVNNLPTPTTLAYDDFGRKRQENRPDGSQSTWDYYWCSATTICPSQAFYYIEKIETGAPKVRAYYDKLQREVRTETAGFDGRWITKDTRYNAKAQVEAESRNYYENEPVYWAQYQYDNLGRVIRLTAPDGSISQSIYAGLQTTHYIDINGKNQQTIRWENALGKLVRLQDNLGGNAYYDYDYFGNLNFVKDPAGNVITLEHDVVGRKTAIIDPDMGRWTYTYYVTGELKAQTDAKGQVTRVTYDRIGRMLTRTSYEGTNEWVYDTAVNGKGRTHQINSYNGTSEIYSYDALARPESVTYNFGMLDGNNSYTVNRSYEAGTGRLNTITYPQYDQNKPRYQIRHSYNANGYLEKLVDVAAGMDVWTATALTSDGQLGSESLGNGYLSDRTYNSQTGAITSIRTRTGSTYVQDLEYLSDPLGNLQWRKDHRQSVTETFCYDGLNRLTHASLNAINCATPGAPDYQYDSIGNITYKKGVGYYTYNAETRPHAVTYVSPQPFSDSETQGIPLIPGDAVKDGTVNALDLYATIDNILGKNYTSGDPDCRADSRINVQDPVCIINAINQGSGSLTGYAYYDYDANGNLISGGGRTVTYTSFNKPRELTGNGVSIRFDYNAEQRRIRQTGTNSSVIYVGALFQKEIRGSRTTYKHFIGTGRGIMAVKVDDSDDTKDTILYLHTDHLGSVDVITDQSGLEKERTSFDAFGLRRLDTWQPGNPLPLAVDNVRQGFTGHEQIDDVGLVHMNARLYDPVLGRFMTPDTIVQFPESTQGFNRYTYVDNNPLSNVDPSGHGLRGALSKAIKNVSSMFEDAGPFGSIIVAAWIQYYMPGVSGSLVAGFTNGVLAGGDLRSGFAGMFSAFMFSTLHEIPGGSPYSMQQFAKSVGHGITGGVQSRFYGNEFRHGFWSAFATQQLQQPIGSYFGGSQAGTVTAAATIGGTASVISGGKFANGAITGAFSRLFNDELQRERGEVLKNPRPTKIYFGDGSYEYQTVLDVIPPELEGASRAARWFARVIDFIDISVERGTRYYQYGTENDVFEEERLIQRDDDGYITYKSSVTNTYPTGKTRSVPYEGANILKETDIRICMAGGLFCPF